MNSHKQAIRQKLLTNWKLSFFHVYYGFYMSSMCIYQFKMINNENWLGPPHPLGKIMAGTFSFLLRWFKAQFWNVGLGFIEAGEKLRHTRRNMGLQHGLKALASLPPSSHNIIVFSSAQCCIYSFHHLKLYFWFEADKAGAWQMTNWENLWLSSMV